MRRSSSHYLVRVVLTLRIHRGSTTPHTQHITQAATAQNQTPQNQSSANGVRLGTHLLAAHEGTPARCSEIGLVAYPGGVVILGDFICDLLGERYLQAFVGARLKECEDRVLLHSRHVKAVGEQEDREHVGGAVAHDDAPVELGDLARDDRRAADNVQRVEHRGADHGADTHALVDVDPLAEHGRVRQHAGVLQGGGGPAGGTDRVRVGEPAQAVLGRVARQCKLGAVRRVVACQKAAVPRVADGEHGDRGDEELGRGGARGHEGGAGHVRRQLQLVDDDLERGDEEVLADQGEPEAHVEHDEEVEEELAELDRLLLQLFSYFRELVLVVLAAREAALALGDERRAALRHARAGRPFYAPPLVRVKVRVLGVLLLHEVVRHEALDPVDRAAHEAEVVLREKRAVRNLPPGHSAVSAKNDSTALTPLRGIGSA